MVAGLKVIIFRDDGDSPRFSDGLLQTFSLQEHRQASLTSCSTAHKLGVSRFSEMIMYNQIKMNIYIIYFKTKDMKLIFFGCEDHFFNLLRKSTVNWNLIYNTL